MSTTHISCSAPTARWWSSGLAWIVDPAAAVVLTASNGLRGVSP